MDSTDLPSKGAPGTRKLIPSRGVVIFNALGDISEVWTRYGFRSPNPWLNRPAPNVTYHVGANENQRARGVHLHHIFRTAFDGVTDSVESLYLRKYTGAEKGQRHSGCVPPGYPGTPYDKGHLIAAEFGAGNETINLVNMPNSVNQGHLPATARRKGFTNLADQADRFLNDTFFGGTYTPRGEWVLPNYRKFEASLKKLALATAANGDRLSLRIRPITVNDRTDVLYAEVFVGQRAEPTRFEIECDIG